MRECTGVLAISSHSTDAQGSGPDGAQRNSGKSHVQRFSRLLAGVSGVSGMRWKRQLLLSGASAAALTALSAGSAAQTWTGSTSSDWTNVANWNTGVPTGGATVIIDLTSPNPTILGVNGPVNGATSNTVFGLSNVANLTIQNGSVLTSTGSSFALGFDAPGRGTVTVTGAGSQWNTSGGQILVGNSGTGILNIANGGQVTALGGIVVGNAAGATGTLNISGGGILETTSLTRNTSATSQVNFDDATIRALASSANFSNFTAAQLNIAAGGLTVDTNGFNVGTIGFSGVGGLTVAGPGTLSLRGTQAYTGQTVIQSGSTLSLQSVDSIAASSRLVTNGTFDISASLRPNSEIQSLAGNGTVTMGTNSLTLTNAHDDTFAGTFLGSGGLTLAGGSETLTGNNSAFTGPTTVQAGTLSVNDSLGGTVDVLSAGRLQGIGTVGTTTNAGVIAPGNSMGSLTIAGNYTGNGGALEIESALAGDSSPTDRLVVTGNTAGTTTVRVLNRGGLGAQTSDGIKIIDVEGVSNGTFSLLGDYAIRGQQAVVAGAYAYTLQKKGISNPSDGDWYLRSSLVGPSTSPSGNPASSAPLSGRRSALRKLRAGAARDERSADTATARGRSLFRRR
jgi:T5SS/PEP-CTERM-associated repeat protein/autotransporter-associated beta strand protein